MDTITEFLLHHDMTVYIVIFDKKAYQISSKLEADIRAYIDDRYVEAHRDSDELICARMRRANAAVMDSCVGSAAPCASRSLEDLVAKLDESFSQMLLRKIDERGMTDAQYYKKANIDRKLFSKIRNDRHYKPSKSTAIAFAIALELPLAEMKELLEKAGFALSHSNKADIIVEYFVSKGIYDIFTINEALFAFDQ